jgi:hypothetical protein
MGSLSVETLKSAMLKLIEQAKRRNAMQLSSPKQITWIVALVLAVLGLLGALFTINILSDYAFWLAFISALLLLLATYLKGL